MCDLAVFLGTVSCVYTTTRPAHPEAEATQPKQLSLLVAAHTTFTNTTSTRRRLPEGPPFTTSFYRRENGGLSRR